MQDQLQRDVEEVISKLRELKSQALKNFIRDDLREAAQLNVSALKAATPVGKKNRTLKGLLYKKGTLKKSMRVLPLRRAKASISVGPQLKPTGNLPVVPFYVRFLEFGTKKMPARRFIERTRERVGPVSQAVALKLLSRRIDQFNLKNFK